MEPGLAARSGITQLESRIERDQSGKVTSFNIIQSLPQEGTSLRPHATTVGAYDFDANGKLVLARRANVDVKGEVTSVPGLVGTNHDVYVLNDQDLAYAKIRFDADSWEIIRTRVGDFEESLPRAVIMCAAWDMVRDGDLSASKYLEMALGALKHETNSSVLNGILRHIQGALTYYAADPDSAHRLLAPALLLWRRKQNRPRIVSANWCGHSCMLRELKKPRKSIVGMRTAKFSKASAWIRICVGIWSSPWPLTAWPAQI